jgi:hypothetical protein
VLLGLLPANFQNTPQRMTELLYFKFLQPTAATVAYVPAQHRTIAERIYAQFPVPVDFRSGAPVNGEGWLVATYRSVVQGGTIQVQQAGANMLATIARARRSLVAAGAQAIYLDLPLAQPQTPELSHAAEAEGFSFAGILPSAAPDGDVLRLQFLNVDLDPALVHVENPFARELLEYMVCDRVRKQAQVV